LPEKGEFGCNSKIGEGIANGSPVCFHAVSAILARQRLPHGIRIITRIFCQAMHMGAIGVHDKDIVSIARYGTQKRDSS